MSECCNQYLVSAGDVIPDWPDEFTNQQALLAKTHRSGTRGKCSLHRNDSAMTRVTNKTMTASIESAECAAPDVDCLPLTLVDMSQVHTPQQCLLVGRARLVPPFCLQDASPQQFK